MSETYVVVATQLNRAVKDAAGDVELTTMGRGTTFTAEDVEPAELKRWLGLKPAVIKTEAELEAAASSAADARAALEDANAQIAELQAQLAAAHAAGAAHAPSEADAGGVLEEPAGNASADTWRAYAKQQDPTNVELDTMSRDELRDKYSNAS